MSRFLREVTQGDSDSLSFLCHILVPERGRPGNRGRREPGGLLGAQSTTRRLGSCSKI